MHSDDLAVIGCLRALSQHSQATGNARIPWGGTKRSDWEAASHRVTFRFSSPDYRNDFVQHVSRLLPKSIYSIICMSDNDPATPQK